jgi:hypothetical protein
MRHSKRCRFCKCFIPKVKKGVFTSGLCRECDKHSDGKLTAFFDNMVANGIMIVPLSKKQTNTDLVNIIFNNKENYVKMAVDIESKR